MNIVNFEDYKKNKINLMNRVLEDTELDQGLAANALELGLKKAGFRRAKVFYQDHNFVVILDTDPFTYMHARISILLKSRTTVKAMFRKFLEERDSRTEDVVIFRRWPSASEAKKLLKKWFILPE